MEKEMVMDPSRPRVGELIEVFKRCGPTSEFWNRLADNEQARFNIWEEQHRDCKKHGTEESPAKPWEGASDQRVFLADEVINDEVALCLTAFWASLVHTDGVGLEDAGSASQAKLILRWYIKNTQLTDLEREVELAAQFWRTYGWVVLHPIWEREVGLRRVPITLEEIRGMFPDAARAITDPSQEEQAVAIVQSIFADWSKSRVGDMVDQDIELSTSDARALVGALRLEGEAKIDVPYVCRNEPKIIALRPWLDVFMPEEAGDLQRGTVFVRWYFREDELRSKVATDGWSEEWVEEAIKTKGHHSLWGDHPTELLSGSTTWAASPCDDPQLIEVVFAYTRRIDSRGLPGIYLTVFSPQITGKPGQDEDLVAVHGLSEYAHGKAPFVPIVREWITRSITASRGVPEVAYPYQRLQKVTQDALIDRTSMTTLPPRLVTPRLLQEFRNQEFGPAAVIPTVRGEDIRFMDPPARDGTAEEILRYSDEKVDTYFGRLSKDVPPERAQTRNQALVGKFLRAWTAAFAQEWALIQQYCPPDEWQRITGEAKPPFQATEIGRNYDVTLYMDVRDLDMEFVYKKLEAVSKFVLPEDSAGVIDKVELVKLKLQAIDPRLAKRLVIDGAAANQKLFEQVNLELASIYLGNPPKLVENDPTAGRQLQFASQIIQQNPNYQAALSQGEGNRFADALKVWADNRMQSVAQEQNKMVGRLGTKPLEQGTP